MADSVQTSVLGNVWRSYLDANHKAAQLQTADVTAQHVFVDAGNLRITADPCTPGQFVGGWNVRIEIDGKPIAARAIRFEISVNGIMSCEMDWFPCGSVDG